MNDTHNQHHLILLSQFTEWFNWLNCIYISHAVIQTSLSLTLINSCSAIYPWIMAITFVTQNLLVLSDYFIYNPNWFNCHAYKTYIIKATKSVILLLIYYMSLDCYCYCCMCIYSGNVQCIDIHVCSYTHPSHVLLCKTKSFMLAHFTLNPFPTKAIGFYKNNFHMTSFSEYMWIAQLICPCAAILFATEFVIFCVVPLPTSNWPTRSQHKITK